MRIENVKKVAVLCGGNSSEREISLKSGHSIADALIQANYHVVIYDIKTCELPEGIGSYDVVFPVLHGGFGEDGSIQALMEARDIAFVGNSSKTCRLLMDKFATKACCVENGLPTPKYTTLDRGTTQLPEGFSLPVVLKVATEGSSFGIAIPTTAEELEKDFKDLFEISESLLLEEFIEGAECSVPVICGNVLPIIQLVVPGKFYDYDAKYTYKGGATQYFCPPRDIEETVQNKIKEIAKKAAEVCGVRHIVRIDFMIDKAGNPYILEGNAIPGCTATSLVPKSAGVAGMSFPQLASLLVETAYEDFNKACSKK